MGRRAQRTEEGAKVLGEQLRFFHRGKVSAARHLRPALDLEEPLRPLAGRRAISAKGLEHRPAKLARSPGPPSMPSARQRGEPSTKAAPAPQNDTGTLVRSQNDAGTFWRRPRASAGERTT